MNESLRTAWKRLSGSGRLALCLALSAGYIDAYGLLRYGTFVSFMSGNTTSAGLSTGLTKFGAALPAAIAIVSFVSGVFAGTLLMHSGRRRVQTIVLCVVAGMLTLSLGLEEAGVFPGNAQIALLGLAMGVMNTTLSQVFTQAVSLTFVTGTLNKIGSHLALAAKGEPFAGAQEPGDTHLCRALVLSAIWLSFLIGAIAAGALTPHLGPRVLLGPLVLLLVVAVVRPADEQTDASSGRGVQDQSYGA